MSTVTFPTTFINRYSRLRCDEQIANEESVGAVSVQLPLTSPRQPVGVSTSLGPRDS